jgi:hypothetical protein
MSVLEQPPEILIRFAEFRRDRLLRFHARYLLRCAKDPTSDKQREPPDQHASCDQRVLWVLRDRQSDSDASPLGSQRARFAFFRFTGCSSNIASCSTATGF